MAQPTKTILLRGIKMVINPAGRILKTSDWTLLQPLTDAGLTKTYGRMSTSRGLTDLFLTDAAMNEAIRAKDKKPLCPWND